MKIEDLSWGKDSRKKNEELIGSAALPMALWQLNNVAESFSSFVELIDALIELKIVFCGKAHEDPRKDVTQLSCPIRKFNISCSHPNNDPLFDALVLAKFFGKVSETEAAKIKAELVSIRRELIFVDEKAEKIYHAGSGDLETIKTAELVYGEAREAIRDRLVEALLA